MPTLFTHPANVKALREHIDHGVYDAGTFMPIVFTIRTSEFMEKTKRTGRYVMPDGQSVERNAVAIRGRFVDFGPEDIEYLVYAGVIRAETEMLVTLMDDNWQFRMMMDTPFVMDRLMDDNWQFRMMMDTPFVMDRRHIVVGSGV